MAKRTTLGNKKPGSRLAFLPDADAAVLAESLVAFANADGGLIVLGLDDEGNLTETIWDEEAEGALRSAASLCQPPVMSQWLRVEVGSAELIGVQVSRSMALHSLADGRVLIRSGERNRPLTGNEVQAIAATRNAAVFEDEQVAGASQEDFDPAMIDEYLAKRETRGGAGRTASLATQLFEIGALDHDGRPTVAGILLFGRNPQAFLPQSGVVFVKFPSTQPRGEDGGAGYGRRDEINGPLARIIERAWNIIWEEMRVGATVNQLEREDLTEYPPFAVREALVNAVCHRDYQMRGSRIEVRMYSDRMEVISPGSLPGYMTLDNLVEEHFSRNPRLVNGLFQWGYIEELGLGIDRMIEDMVQAGHPPPTFRATPYSFTVTLANVRERAPIPKWTRNMNERQSRALTYVRESGSITNREYQNLCPDVTPETLRLDLVDLVEKGLLLKIGSKKGTHYILK